MYNGQPYVPTYNNYNPQPSLDRINDQINQLETMKKQIQQTPPIQPQPTNLTQNFQIAPTTNREVIKYANSIDEVERDMVIGDTPYFSRDLSIVWIKNTKGNIKTYELTEIIPRDEKDMQIEMLQAQIDELKKGMKSNEQHYTNVDESENETSTTTSDGDVGTTVEKNKPTSISKLSTSKKR